MKRFTGLMPALFTLLVVGIPGMAWGQDKADDKTMGEMPPKVLFIMREYTKPGKPGAQHEKSESLFVQAMTKAKFPTHYLAVESLSGPSRALFLTGFESFAAWEKDFQTIQKNAVLASALDHAGAVDGELLSETDQAAATFSEEYSFRPLVDIAHSRYFEISLYQVKQGHEKDWAELVKLVKGAYEKIPEAHWVAFQCVYGLPDTSYIIFNPMKSAAEIDRNFASGKQFEAAMGEAGMKRLSELSAAAVEMSQTNLFAFNPRMSYPAPEWIKADPDFWKPKAMPKAEAAKKPAQ